ncbi:MAG: FtsX-like permease family protein [Candidatus Hodarchaeales archaeon]
MQFLSRYWRKKLVRDIKGQSLLFFGIFFLCFFGISSYIALTMGYTNLYATIDNIYAETNFADAEISTKSDIWFNTTEISSFTEEYQKNHPEILQVNYRLLTEVGYNSSYNSSNTQRYQLNEGRAVGINWSSFSADIVNGLIFTEGENSSVDQMNNSILLEAHYAREYDLNTGDHLQTKIQGNFYNFTIKGLVYSPESLILISSKYASFVNKHFGIIFLPINHLQLYTNYTGLANNIIIKTVEGLTVEGQKLLINDFFQELNLYTDESFSLPVFKEHQISNWALNLDLEEFEKVALVLPILILGVTSISIFITLNRLVQSQRRIIGIAASLGYAPIDILLHYASFTLIIGGLSGGLALIFGSIASGGITWVYAYFMGFPTIVVIKVQMSILIVAFTVSLLITFFSGIVPAWRANRLSPREAFQIQLSTKEGGFSIVEKILNLQILNIKIVIPFRNLFRQRWRTFITILAISSSVMILVVSAGFNDSISAGIGRQFSETSQYDMMINYDTVKYADFGVKEDINYIKHLPGVVSVDPVLEIPSVLRIGDREEDVLIIAWNSTSPSTHNFQWTSKNDHLALNQSIVLTSGLAKSLGVTTGDNLSYGYPSVPNVDGAYAFAMFQWDLWLTSNGYNFTRNRIMDSISSRLLSQNIESYSLSNESEEVRFRMADISMSGISEEIWGSVCYTTVQTLSAVMGIDVFKKSVLDIDLTPFSKLIVKISDPQNLTLLEALKSQITDREGILSIRMGYDIQESATYTMTMFTIIISVFILFACILVGMAIFTTIYVNFQERSQEIATMLTLGLSDREFLSILTIENVIQAIIGILGGIIPGLLLADWILSNLLRMFYFKIQVSLLSWIALWSGVILVVLLSQIPAIYRGLKLDLATVTKEISQ